MIICFNLEIRWKQDPLRVQNLMLLSAETVEIFSKDFSEQELRTGTENIYHYNRVGTRNRFLFMAFSLYFETGIESRKTTSKSITSIVGLLRRKEKITCQTI